MFRNLSSLLRSAACAAVLLGLAGNTLAERKAPPPKKGEDSFRSGAPFTFEQVLKLASQAAIPLHRRKEGILNRGIDFSLTQDQAEKLKAAGAPDELLKAIRGKAKPAVIAAPPPPKKDPVGTVALSCAPIECDISLNGTPVGPTKDGKMEITKHPGKMVIDFGAKGYIGHQITVSVEADKTVPVSAVL